MENTKILKIIELLEKNNVDEAKQILQLEILKNEKGSKNCNLVEFVKKYLKRNKTRPVLQYIQTLHEKQTILDGYTMFIFDEYNKDLEILDKIPEELKNNQFDYEKLLTNQNNYEYENTDEDFKLILKNINKIIAFAKSKDYEIADTFGKFIPIAYNKYFFDAKRLQDVYNVMQNFDNLQINKNNSFLQLKNEKITAVICPMTLRNECQNYVKTFTDDVLNILKGGEK